MRISLPGAAAKGRQVFCGGGPHHGVRTQVQRSAVAGRQAADILLQEQAPARRCSWAVQRAAASALTNIPSIQSRPKTRGQERGASRGTLIGKEATGERPCLACRSGGVNPRHYRHHYRANETCLAGPSPPPRPDDHASLAGSAPSFCGPTWGPQFGTRGFAASRRAATLGRSGIVGRCDPTLDHRHPSTGLGRLEP